MAFLVTSVKINEQDGSSVIDFNFGWRLVIISTRIAIILTGFSSAPPCKCRDKTSDYAAGIAFHIPLSSIFTIMETTVPELLRESFHKLILINKKSI
jgi:hypothetical protein